MATPIKVNRIGLEPQVYKGGKTTLCAGCGHNAISERIVDASSEMGVDPSQVIKLSGIGCSSKSPAYFLGTSHGFNAVHGRMPSVGTGAMLANKKLIAIGVSGDGDTGAIGIGQFVHLMRRNLPIVYIIEDIAVDYAPGSAQEVTMHDGSKLILKKLEEAYDPTDRINAMKRLHETARRGEFATGLIYIEPDRDDFLTQLNVVDEPLATLPLERVRPGREALDEIMEALR